MNVVGYNEEGSLLGLEIVNDVPWCDKKEISE